MQVHRRHLGAMRPLGGMADEQFHLLGGARDQGFDRAVRAVADPAVQLVMLGGGQQEIAEAHPLDNAMYLDPQGRNIIVQHVLLTADILSNIVRILFQTRWPFPPAPCPHPWPWPCSVLIWRTAFRWGLASA